MRTIAASGLAFFFATILLQADESPAAQLTKLAEALSQNDSARALACFDPAMSGYAQVKFDIESLVKNPQLSSSIEVVKDTESAGIHKLDTMWTVQLTPADNDPPRKRRDNVQVEMRQIEGNWKITSLPSLHILGPPDRGPLERIARLATDLTGNDTDAALDDFDTEMPDYGTIETNIEAITEQADISCDIDVLVDNETDGVHKLDLDWLMQLTSQADDSVLDRRRERVTVEVKDIKGRWKITSLTPLKILDPLRPR